MRGRGQLARILTTIAPTAPATTVRQIVPGGGSRTYVITGTHAGNEFELSPSTQYSFSAGVAGTMLTIENASTQFITVHLSGVTAFHHYPIAPGGSMTLTLLSQATAAGTWATDRSAGHFRPIEDRFNAAAVSAGFGWSAASANGGSAGVGFATQAGGAGAVRVSCGNTNADGYGVYHATSGTTGGFIPDVFVGAAMLDESIWTRTMPAAAPGDEYSMEWGWSNVTNNAAFLRRLGWEVNIPTNGNARTYMIAADDPNVTRLDTGVTFANSTMYRTTLIRASGATRLDGWIDRVHVGTITTHHPTVLNCNKHYRVIGTSGTGGNRYFLASRCTEMFCPVDTDH